MRVRTPDGQQWTVRRQWAPRLEGRGLRARLRKRDKGADKFLDVADATDAVAVGDTLASIAAVIAILCLLVFLVLVGLPLLLALVDLVVVVALVVGGVVARVLFRRPWTVEALADDGERHTWQVVGWRSSGTRRRHVAEALAAGQAAQSAGAND